MKKMTNKMSFALVTGLCLALFGLSGTARAVESDEALLKQMPENMPGDYSDEEIDRMLSDVQEIEESSETDGTEAADKPALTERDRELLEDIEKDPDRYADEFRSAEWLEQHHVVIWHLCSDYAWPRRTLA